MYKILIKEGVNMKDLHLHLSGSTDPVLLFEIITETGLKLKNKN